MILNNLQIVIIKDTYDVFEESKQVQDILAPVWALKLKGYKSFFDYGVCPNDKYDFFSNHIIFTRKDDLTRPLGAIKNISLKTCEDSGVVFPPVKHMFGENISQDDYLQVYAVNKWIEKFASEGIGYSMGYTVDPDLPKELRRFMFGLLCFSFSAFYKDSGIPNIIHGVNTLSKIDKGFEDIGFKDILLGSFAVPSFEMPEYNNLAIRLMVSENYGVDVSSLPQLDVFKSLWNDRLEISRESLVEAKKVA